MSNNTSPETSGQYDRDTWNTSQLFKITGVMGVLVGAILLSSKMQDDTNQEGTHNQPLIIDTILANKESFQGVQIIRIGNPAEIHTLKSSGKDGVYVFQEGNIVTYWKIQSGIVESNTYTLNR